MSKPTIAVVAERADESPMHFNIVDLSTTDDSRTRFGGDGMMFARKADPHMSVPPYRGFKIVLGVFETFDLASKALAEARAIWFSKGEAVDAASWALTAAEEAVKRAQAALTAAEEEQRRAIRSPFLGTPAE